MCLTYFRCWPCGHEAPIAGGEECKPSIASQLGHKFYRREFGPAESLCATCDPQVKPDVGCEYFNAQSEMVAPVPGELLSAPLETINFAAYHASLNNPYYQLPSLGLWPMASDNYPYLYALDHQPAQPITHSPPKQYPKRKPYQYPPPPAFKFNPSATPFIPMSYSPPSLLPSASTHPAPLYPLYDQGWYPLQQPNMYPMPGYPVYHESMYLDPHPAPELMTPEVEMKEDSMRIMEAWISKTRRATQRTNERARGNGRRERGGGRRRR